MVEIPQDRILYHHELLYGLFWRHAWAGGGVARVCFTHEAPMNLLHQHRTFPRKAQMPSHDKGRVSEFGIETRFFTTKRKRSKKSPLGAKSEAFGI